MFDAGFGSSKVLRDGERTFMKVTRTLLLAAAAACGFGILVATAATDKKAASAGPKVSYYKQVRPILQANCQGCHQPAKSKGGYVMTDFAKLLAGGDNEGKAVVPGHPEKSSVIKQITPDKGEAVMPKGKPALPETEVALIRQWIAQGAADDTPDRKSVV